MARIVSSLLALAFAVCAFGVNAAPHHTRQSGPFGDLQCTTAELEIFVSLIGAENAIQQINSTSTDPTTLAAVASAQTDFIQAAQGIENIALAFSAGQTPAVADINNVGNAIGAMQTALSMIVETTPAVVTELAAAQGNLTNAVTAGNVTC